MTEQKHLKRLIRARVARTGESYSTARRIVIDQLGREPAVALPSGLVPGYPAFGGGSHRESVLLAHLLEQAGHVAPHTGQPYSEAMVCGLAGGIGFMYALFEYRGVPPILTIVAQHHPDPWAPAALNRLGVGFVEEHSASARPALSKLYQWLDRGRAVYCTVAGHLLPGQASSTAGPHPVVVAGYEGSTVWLDDQASTPTAIAEDRFVASWSAHPKGRHHRLIVGEPTGSVDLPRAIRAAIATTVSHLTGPVLGHSFDVNFGFSGLAKLSAQLRDGRKAGWGHRFAGAGALAFALRRLYECLELQYTAPGATRALYAEFLDEAAGVLDDAALARAAVRFRESGQAFSAVAARAAEVLDRFGPYADLVEQRMFAQLTGCGDDAQIEELSARIEAIGPGALDLGPAERAALFAGLADLFDTAQAAETAAVHLLQPIQPIQSSQS
jgi:hypothetical protein